MTWSIDQSKRIYNLNQWGEGYFDISRDGHLMVRPVADTERGIDLLSVTNQLVESGLSLPVLLRFPDILRHRAKKMMRAFDDVMQKLDYQGRYFPVYPIKVNQQRHVVEEIAAISRVGLEAGSKAELLVVMAMINSETARIVCNGYKDHEYIRLALIGRQMGLNVCIVLEKLSEIDIVVEEAKKLDVKPLLGLRIRMSSAGKGNWQNSGGDLSKFGLSSSQVILMVEKLSKAGMSNSVGMLHFHLGSQVADIKDIKNGLKEAAVYFAQLCDLGLPIQSVDVGGGLGVDYEGTSSQSYFSMNYGIEDYATQIVSAFKAVCLSHNLRPPDILTESGRAMTAHHAVLLTNVVEVEKQILEAHERHHRPLKIIDDLRRLLVEIDSTCVLDSYRLAVEIKARSCRLFSEDSLTINEKSVFDQLFVSVNKKILDALDLSLKKHRALRDKLSQRLADKYFCNFSVFQSLPDVWAIDQIFPILPIHRLNLRPDRNAVIVDVSCDSDGRIDRYVDQYGIESTLPLHGLGKGAPYVLAFCLVGAYQEILGDMHNLFGDTHSVNIELSADGSYEIVRPELGDTVADVLDYVHFDKKHIYACIAEKLGKSTLNKDERRHYLHEINRGLEGYTYVSTNVRT